MISRWRFNRASRKKVEAICGERNLVLQTGDKDHYANAVALGYRYCVPESAELPTPEGIS